MEDEDDQQNQKEGNRQSRSQITNQVRSYTYLSIIFEAPNSIDSKQSTHIISLHPPLYSQNTIRDPQLHL